MHGFVLAKIFDYIEYHGYMNMEELNMLVLEAETEMPPVLSAHYDDLPRAMQLLEVGRDCEA